MSNQDWTSKLQEQLADYQEPVSHDLWAGIEQSLAHSETVKKPRIVYFKRWSAAAAAVALLGIGGSYVYLHQEDVEKGNLQMASLSSSSSSQLGITAKDSVLKNDRQLAEHYKPVSQSTPSHVVLSSHVVSADLQSAVSQSKMGNALEEESENEISLLAENSDPAESVSEDKATDSSTDYKVLTRSTDNHAAAYASQSYHFEKNEDNPIEADAVILDEMSMVDIHLMYSLLKAIVPGTRLILVGDSNQLPSVGPGNVLKDIIDSKAFSVVRLSKIYRQAESSHIVLNAHKINAGELITLDNKNKDFFFFEKKDVRSVMGALVYLVKTRLPEYIGASPFEIQVLTPMRKGELGVEHLNEVLQYYLNPASESKKEKEGRTGVFREGDKVMQVKNNYKLEWKITNAKGFSIEEGLGVFNGDMGIIKQINTYSERITVVFDENREAEYPFSSLDELELAYAITIHKSQGSEYPAVVLPLLSGPPILCNRNLLYTAITRAQKCVAIAGRQSMVEQMIHNETEQKRYSGLNDCLKEGL